MISGVSLGGVQMSRGVSRTTTALCGVFGVIFERPIGLERGPQTMRAA